MSTVIPITRAEALIPRGEHCYRPLPEAEQPADGLHQHLCACPFWWRDPAHEPQANGYCRYLRQGDWEAQGISLLWDMVKECGIKTEEM